jgi:small GTP-binding protein
VSEVPRFAVVGRVNKGKSSIVATLAEDESVHIDARPGTTTEVREYPVRVDGQELFVLVDTPGFEDAPRALAWLRARELSAAERPARVAELVRAFEGTEEFVDERRLLAPILAGASVLYVVDGTKPYRENYEAEMEILRWTGQPRMALVNRIGEGDHGAEWHRALDQYFPITRDFDAQAAGFRQRLQLLETFRELRPGWRPAIDAAVTALVAQRRRRRAAAAAEIASLLVDELTHVEEITVEDEAQLERERDRLERSFHDALRAREEKARRRVEALYGHERTRFVEEVLARPVFRTDLFAEETWKMLGLSPGQLVAASALAGAAAGGVVDAAVGGASFMAGAVAGGAIGGGAALYGVGRRLARVRQVFPGGLLGFVLGAGRAATGSRRYRIGPHAQPNFPWVLLDRALLHHDAVAHCAHARRGTVRTDGGDGRAGVVSELARDERGELAAAFRELRRSPSDPSRETCAALEVGIERILARIDPVPGEDDREP